MNDQADNPYAAPQEPPEKKLRPPWAVCRRAAVAGATAFILAFTITAGLATFVYIVGTEAYGKPDADGEAIVRTGALAFAVLFGPQSGPFLD